jgi:hypothetical protein
MSNLHAKKPPKMLYLIWSRPYNVPSLVGV